MMERKVGRYNRYAAAAAAAAAAADDNDNAGDAFCYQEQTR